MDLGFTYINGQGWNDSAAFNVYSVTQPITGNTNNFNALIELSFSYEYESSNPNAPVFSSGRGAFYNVDLETRRRVPFDRTKPFDATTNPYGGWSSWVSHTISSVYARINQRYHGGDFTANSDLSVIPGEERQFRLPSDRFAGLGQNTSEWRNFSQLQVIRPSLRVLAFVR